MRTVPWLRIPPRTISMPSPAHNARLGVHWHWVCARVAVEVTRGDGRDRLRWHLVYNRVARHREGCRQPRPEPEGHAPRDEGRGAGRPALDARQTGSGARGEGHVVGRREDSLGSPFLDRLGDLGRLSVEAHEGCGQGDTIYGRAARRGKGAGARRGRKRERKVVSAHPQPHRSRPWATGQSTASCPWRRSLLGQGRWPLLRGGFKPTEMSETRKQIDDPLVLVNDPRRPTEV
jgi:hypothetical protein